MFVEALWVHQYLRKPTPLTPELDLALHEASTGITEVAVRVFMFAQRQTIAEAERPSEERLTPEGIRAVPLSELGLMEPVLQALREGQVKKIDRVDDVSMDTPPAIEDAVAEFTPRSTERLNSNSDDRKMPKLTNKLLEACAEQSSHLPAYERLERAGFVRPVSEFM